MGMLRAQLSDSGVAFKSVFSNPNLRRTQLALAGASLGGSAYMLAVSVYAYQQGGVNAVGFVWLIRMIPSALFAPIGGLLADRYPRLRVMMAADGIRLGLMLVAALSIWRGWPAGIVYAISVVNSMCRSPYESANSARLPSLARTPAELTAANAVSGTIDSVGMFVGPALAGAILAGVSISAGFLFTAAMIAWSLIQVIAIRVPKAEAEEPTLEATDADAASAMRRFLAEVLAGFKAIGSDSRLALMLGLFAAASAVAGALEVLMVDVALNELDIGNAGLGYLNTAYGVGALAGAFLTAGLAGKRRLSSPFVVGALLCGAPVLIAAFPNTGAAVVAMTLLGIGNPLVDVPCFTILQRAVPQAILGRAFGALSLIWLSSIGIGAIVVPLLLHVMSLRATLIVVGAFVPVLVVIFWRALFDIDAKAVAPAGDLIELLRLCRSSRRCRAGHWRHWSTA